MSIKKIGILTSGGDAPGMNAAARAVAKRAMKEGIEVYAIFEGYRGLHDGKIEKVDSTFFADVINRGGTILKSARFPEFKEESTRQVAIDQMKKVGLEALVVIGGDGSYMGAYKLSKMGYPCIGLPGTIDNDIASTDRTIGFSTALNTITNAVTQLRDTASSHKRLMIVEAMGRYCGDLSLYSSIASGADILEIAETGTFDEQRFIEKVNAQKNDKYSMIAMVAEKQVDVNELAKRVEEQTGVETRGVVLSQIQRGGNPTAEDVVLASRMGDYAVDLLLNGETGRCVGVKGNTLVHYDIIEAIEDMKHELDEELYQVNKNLI